MPFSKMTHPGDVFAVDCLRSILPSEGIVAEMNEDYKDAVQAHRINDANLSLQIDDMGKAAQSFANEPKTGHAAQIVNTELANMRMRLTLEEREEVCRWGHHHRCTLVIVTSTGLTEGLSRRMASFAIQRL
ncbi:uncharacterized protein LOC142575559 isoform X2 [Dermacentor variabilis]|uniref:uncharacterized protein LOC142575559 isoform X2 n=1 Tax=Dermacentor variabilis TaxID=34621 RepID=UPI003F5BAC5B